MTKIIQSFVRRLVTEAVIQDIKQEVMTQLNEMTDFKDTLKEYAAKELWSSSPDAFWAMKEVDFARITLKFTLVYTRGKHEVSKEFSNVGELVLQLKNLDKWEDLHDKDIIGVSSIDLLVWSEFKGESSLNSTYFLGHGVHRREVINKVVDKILGWAEKHPELLV